MPPALATVEFVPETSAPEFELYSAGGGAELRHRLLDELDIVVAPLQIGVAQPQAIDLTETESATVSVTVTVTVTWTWTWTW